MHETHHTNIVPVLAVTVFALGAVGAWLLYRGAAKDPVEIPALRNKRRNRSTSSASSSTATIAAAAAKAIGDIWDDDIDREVGLFDFLNCSFGNY